MTLINIDKLFQGLSSVMKKWTRPWREIESVTESERECKCFAAKGITCKGKARKQILCTSIPHSGFPSSHPHPHPHHPLPPKLCISPSPSHSLYPWSSFTVESPKWQHIKHLGTEAPRVLINASLALKMITSRMVEWRMGLGWVEELNSWDKKQNVLSFFYRCTIRNH